MSDKSVIGQNYPIPVEVEAGKSYFWCKCGRSRSQPFCDGSHKDTGISPVKWTAEKSGKKFFCGCKQSGGEPFCDGTHNKISHPYHDMSYKDVAKIYNDINNIPLDAADDLGRAVAKIVGEGATIMDFGGGAGRISVPIAKYTDMTALDIEVEMLRASKLLAEERGINMRHVVGDVMGLPYPDNSFDAIITTNVLHQVPGWRDALLEAARIMKPGAPMIFGRDNLNEDSCAFRLRSKLREITGELDPDMRPTDAAGPTLFTYLMEIGGRPVGRDVACTWVETVSANDILSRMQNRTHNETWSLGNQIHGELMNRIREWADSEFDDLDAKEDVNWSFELFTVGGLA